MAWKISTPAEDRAVWSCKERFQLTEISEKKGLPNPQTVQTLSVGNCHATTVTYNRDRLCCAEIPKLIMYQD